MREGAGGFHFVPMGVETGERLGAVALRLLSEFGDVAAASISRLSKAAFVRFGVAEFFVPRQRGRVCGIYVSPAGVGRVRRAAG